MVVAICVLALGAAAVASVMAFMTIWNMAQAHGHDHAIHYGDAYLWGSASQAYIYSPQASFFGSDDDPWGYREVTLGGRYDLRDNVHMVMQGEYRTAGESDTVGMRMSQAYMDAWMPIGKSSIVGARAGRIEPPFSFYNKTRDSIFSRPSVILPQSVYLESLGVRDTLISGDGMVLYGRHEMGDSAIEARAGAFVPPFIEDGSSFEGRIMESGWIDYSWTEKLRLRLTMMHAEDGDTVVTYPVFGAQSILGKWTLTSEWGRLNLDTPAGRISTDGVYGQVEYLVTPNMALIARYDHLEIDIDSPLPIALGDDALAADGFMFGGSYDFNDHVRMNIEYHYSDGTVWLNRAENPGLTPGREWDALIMMMSVRF